MDQVTPYGTIKFTQGGGQFDQAGYDNAMAQYQNQQALIHQNAGLQEYYGKTGQLLSAPNRSDFMANPDQWSSEIQLSDVGQQLLNAQNNTALGLASLQQGAMGRVNDALSTPFDTSGIPGVRYNVDSNTGMDSWNKYSDLLMQRMNPDLNTQQAALDTKLANQGITQGSEAWKTQQQQFAKQRNDANVAAQLAGAQLQGQMFNQALENANLNNTGRQQSLTERSTIRNMPLQELNALRSGSQVQNPTFSTPGMQGQTSGPDLMGAAQGNYNAALNQANAQNAAAATNTSAAASIAAGALAYFF